MYIICPIIVVTFVYKFYTQSVTTIMGQKEHIFNNNFKLKVCQLYKQ